MSTVTPTRIRVRVRRLDRRDAGPAVDTVFAGLSPRSRYLRFHAPMPRLSPWMRARLADVDGRGQVAVVAEVRDPGGWRAVGIARFAGSDGRRADLAVAVVDAWQRRGIGRRLLTALVDLATDLGLAELEGTVLPENAAMLALARRALPASRRVFDGDVVRIVVPLGPTAYTLTHEDLLADVLGR